MFNILNISFIFLFTSNFLCAWQAYDYGKAAVVAQKGDLKTAQDTMQKLLTDAPDNAELLYDLGVISCKQKEFEHAAAYFKQATQIDVLSETFKEQALFNLGNTYVQLDKLLDAITAYEDVLALNENNEYAKHNLEIVRKMLEEQENQQEQQSQDQQNEEGKDQSDSDNDSEQENQDDTGSSNDSKDSNQENQESDQENDAEKNNAENGQNDQGDSEQSSQDKNGNEQNDQGEQNDIDGQQGDQGDQAEDAQQDDQGNEERDMEHSSQEKQEQQTGQQKEEDRHEQNSHHQGYSQEPEKERQQNMQPPSEEQTTQTNEQEQAVGANQLNDNLDLAPEDQWIARLLNAREKEDEESNKKIMKATIDKNVAGQDGQNCW